MIRAVVLDLDGTLLRSDGTVSAASRHALQQLCSTDVRVVAATARAPRGVRSIVPEIPWAVCCNGAIIYDNTHHRITWERPFETAAAIEIVERTLKVVPGVGFAARCGDDLVCNQHYADQRSTPLPPGAQLVEQAADLDGHTVHGLAFRRAELDAADIHTAAHEALSGRGRPSTSNASILDVAPPGVTKTLALEVLAGQQHWSAEHAVAFGDMPNDLDVLAWAGLAVAVANAHPDVLHAADLVTDANDNDGVANALRQLGLVTPER